MLFVSLHSVGGLACFETPVAYGPRHCGQKRSPVAAAEPLWPDKSATRNVIARTIEVTRKNAALTRALLVAGPRVPGEDQPRSMSVVWRDDTPPLADDRLDLARAGRSLCRAE